MIKDRAVERELARSFNADGAEKTASVKQEQQGESRHSTTEILGFIDQT